ncbi:MAG: metallophosphoesterase [Candidatus Thorarchaeota archaeon]
MTSSVRRDVLRLLIESGFQITPDALEYILNQESPMNAVETVLLVDTDGELPQVLSKSYVESLIEGITWDYRVEKNPEQDLVGSEGTVEDFLSLFIDRFNRIKRIYMGRIDTQNAVSPYIAKLRKESAKTRKAMNREGMRTTARASQVVLGVVSSKSLSRSKNVIVELEHVEKVEINDQIEDRYSTIICVIPATREGLKGQQLAEKANSLLLDEVVCLSGFVDEEARMIADDVIFPDIPTARPVGRAKREVYAAFISDIHCGSKEFLEDDFDRFIDWMNGRDVEESDKHLVQNIRYLFIAGDMVDGISVYPTQRFDLEITSIFDQYALFASKIKKLPKRVKIFCIPGNHDASRQALPKPPISAEFADPLYKLGNRITMLGDPSQVIVEGVNVLMTHGDSMDDLVTNVPGASYTEPAAPMKELLRKRHLVPLYGGKTELAPLHRDWMVIDTPPDVVHFGHAHHNAVDNYRGVQIINSGTFQSQTDFMRKQGIVPTPGIVTFLNLQTGAPEIKFFHDLST